MVVVDACRHQACRILDRLGEVMVEDAEVGVDLRGGALDEREGPDVLAFQGGAGDREVLDGALGLCPPPGMGGYADLAHRVVFDPEVAVLRHGPTLCRGPARLCDEVAGGGGESAGGARTGWRRV